VSLRSIRFAACSIWLLGTGCRALDATNHVDLSCLDACRAELPSCERVECERGCTLMVDRIAENQSNAVLACMKRAKTCSDSEFAACAVRVGPFADGGGLQAPMFATPTPALNED
jgi:hypothetical protein